VPEQILKHTDVLNIEKQSRFTQPRKEEMETTRTMLEGHYECNIRMAIPEGISESDIAGVAFGVRPQFLVLKDGSEVNLDSDAIEDQTDEELTQVYIEEDEIW
jgi:hypothetical protein